MSEPKKSTPAIEPGGPPGDLTEAVVRDWLETFYASEVVSKAEIAKRLAKRAAFWKA